MKIKNKKIVVVIFIIYVAVLLKITVFRADFLNNQLFSGKFNLVPFVDFTKLNLKQFVYLVGGNIVWFVPLGFLIPILDKKGEFKKVLLFGFLFSFLIETLQFIFGVGVSEIDDLILNTLGTSIGFVLYKLLKLN